MKNLSLILNIVLLVAVGVLFYLHFAGSGSGSSSSGSNGAGLSAIDAKVAFVRSDSILEHYDYLKVKRDQLEAKTKKLEQEYRNRAQGLQNEIANYQQTVNNLTLSQAKALEEDLGRKQQNLRLYEQSLTQDLMNEEAKLNQELYDRVTAYLKKYGQENGLHYVLKFDPSSDLLFAGDSLDITAQVIAGLNADYQQESTTKADSTATKK